MSVIIIDETKGSDLQYESWLGLFFEEAVKSDILSYVV